MSTDLLQKKLCLGSASPRRKELLESVGLSVNVCPADIDETIRKQELPRDYVIRLAKEKAFAVAEKYIDQQALPILASDTIVVCNGEVFGKPKDFLDAQRMWKALSGKTHQVMTSVAVLTSLGQLNKNRECRVALSVSSVEFMELNDQQMKAYWATNEPIDKAGAYAIQGLAAAWVKSVNGSYSGVVGLPLFETNRLLSDVGLNWL